MYIVFSDDVTETMLVSQHNETVAILVSQHNETVVMLVSQNKETVAMLVSQTSPEENEFLSYADAFFCSHKFA